LSQVDADNRFLSPLLRRIAEMGVPASLAPLPSLSLDELYHELLAEARTPALLGLNPELCANSAEKEESNCAAKSNQQQHEVRDVWWAGARGVGRGPDGLQPWSAQELEAEIAGVNHQGAVNPILLGALTRAQEAVAAFSSSAANANAEEEALETVLAHVHPLFARKLWRHMTNGMKEAFSSQPKNHNENDKGGGQDRGAPSVSSSSLDKPNVVVFANARDPSDQLLARAARLLNPHMQLVMDLPNLWPSNVAQLELNALVAPSTFAAEHFSVRQAVAEAYRVTAAGDNIRDDSTEGSKSPSKAVRKPPLVHVIPPGVNVTAFHPAATASSPSSSLLPKVAHGHDHTPTNPTNTSSHGFKRGPASPSIGFMGRLATEKSPGLFLRAAALVAQTWPSLRVVVIGDGECMYTFWGEFLEQALASYLLR